jgi:hypothetical protein
MQKYYSNLIVLERDQNEGIFCKGRGWQITLEPNPDCGICVRPRNEPAKEIVVLANSINRAQYAVDLVFAAHCLNAAELLADEPNRVFARRPRTTRDIAKQLQEGRGNPLGVYHLPVACLVAAKASQRLAHQYALFKYLVSHRIVPLAHNVLEPRYGWNPSRAISESSSEHVFNAHAIIAAYSVLEELSLELRASQVKPSRVNGQWNPVVKRELESRLLKSNIDLSEPIVWSRRGTPTKIERHRQLSGRDGCEWNQGNVRDVYVEVIDAIAYSSWLRSRVSSHKLGRLSKSLTICDVSNVQHLARRLLQETLGFWHYYERHPEMLALYQGAQP